MIMSDTSSVLHAQPDGMGYYYGHYRGRRIDISAPPLEVDPEAFIWRLFVDGDPVGDGFDSKEKAEAAGKLYIERWLSTKDEDDAG